MTEYKKRDPQEIPLTMLINELSKLFHIRMKRECERIGVKDGYRHILFHLSREGNLTQQDLTKRTHFKSSTISVALKNMVADGYVLRESDPDDARKTRLSLTEKGFALDQALRAAIDRTDQLFTQTLDNSDCEQLKSYLIQIRSEVLDEA